MVKGFKNFLQAEVDKYGKWTAERIARVAHFQKYSNSGFANDTGVLLNTMTVDYDKLDVLLKNIDPVVHEQFKKHVPIRIGAGRVLLDGMISSRIETESLKYTVDLFVGSDQWTFKWYILANLHTHWILLKNDKVIESGHNAT